MIKHKVFPDDSDACPLAEAYHEFIILPGAQGLIKKPGLLQERAANHQAGRGKVQIRENGPAQVAFRQLSGIFRFRPADAGAWEKLLDQAAYDRLLNANADA